MDRLQLVLDELVQRLRAGRLLGQHGFTILFHAASAVAALILFKDLTLDHFEGRPLGQAALDAVDVGARTALVPQGVLTFVLVAALSAAVLTWLESRVERGVLAALNASSLAGVALLWLSVWKVWVPTAMALLVAGQMVLVGLALLDRRRVGEIQDRGLYAAWLGALAFALLFPLHDFALKYVPKHEAFVPSFVFAAMLGLELARRSARFGLHGERAARASDRFVHAATPLAVLPAITVMRNEVYLLLNQWGILSVRPDHVEIGLLALLAAWCALRFVRFGRPDPEAPRLDLERVLGRFAFPWMLGAFSALGHFYFLIEPSTDFLEPANAGLFIQQLHEFGRWPFLETFNAHGLADSFFGFVYTALVGFGDESWQMFDFLFQVGMVLVAFQVLRRITRGACPAFFVLAGTHLMDSLFPAYCALSAVGLFVVTWAVRQRSAPQWALFWAFLAFGLLWRLDMGFAVSVASVVTLVAVAIVVPDHRIAWGAALRGACLFGAVAAACFLGVSAWRGIAPVDWLLDMKAIVSSNQAFGGQRIANARTEIVMLHVFAIPMAVVLVVGWMFVRLRGRVDVRDPKFPVVVAVLFFTGYTFANFPRGLVRHTFFEVGNTMTTSFAFLVLASTPYWLLHESRRVAAFAGFLAISTTLAFNAGLENPAERAVPLRPNPIERTVADLRRYERVAYSEARIDRTPVPPWFGPKHVDRIVPFLNGELSPDETFLDLSHSPMLYFHAHRVAPHYMNHLLIVYGERLQRRVLEEVAEHDVPIVILRMDKQLAAAAGVPEFNSLDDVPFAMRHYRLHEWVFENYVPFATLQRFETWIRKDRLLQNPPACTAERALVRWNAGELEFGARSVGPASGETTRVRIGPAPEPTRGPRVALDPSKCHFVRLRGRSEREARLSITWSTRATGDPESATRSVVWPPGPGERFLFVPAHAGVRYLDEFAVDWDPGFEPGAIEWVEGDSVECAVAAQRVHANEVFELGFIPYLWGSTDPDFTGGGAVLRDLSRVDHVPGVPDVPIADVNEGPYARGIRTDRAGFRQGTASDVAPITLVVGHRLAFASGAVRDVVAIDGNEITLDGPPLDPQEDGAPRRIHFAVRRPAGEADPALLQRDGQQRFVRFEPLESRDGGKYLVLRVKCLQPKAARLIVDFGVEQLILGRIALRLEPDREFHDYAVRLTTQYNWYQNACNWIGMTPEGSAIQIESARITRGD